MSSAFSVIVYDSAAHCHLFLRATVTLSHTSHLRFTSSLTHSVGTRSSHASGNKGCRRTQEVGMRGKDAYRKMRAVTVFPIVRFVCCN